MIEKDPNHINMRWVETEPSYTSKFEKPKMTSRERWEEQRRQNHIKSEETWQYVQARMAAEKAQQEENERVLKKLQEQKLEGEKKITQVEFPSVEDVLANPSLDSIQPVNIDSASMLAQDVSDFVKEGQSFIENPSVGSAAMMAALLIPGKVIDGPVRKFIGKYKGEDVVLKHVNLEEIPYTKRDRETYDLLRKKFNSSVRKDFLKKLVDDESAIKLLKEHGVTEKDIIYRGQLKPDTRLGRFSAIAGGTPSLC